MQNPVNHRNVNLAAAFTIIASASCTFLSAVAINTNPAISTVAMVAYGVLATFGVGGGIAGYTAWNRTNSGKVSDFKRNFYNDAVIATSCVIKAVADSFFKAIIDGAARAFGDNVYDRFRKRS